jgi:tRNA threonylcarbamoyl adenosine modification protein YeaZ
MSRKILSIDTCGFKYSVAILDVDNSTNIIDEFRSDESQMQCEGLTSSIENLLAGNSLSYSDLDLIAVTAGPGTFNGVRIGFAFAQGISIACGIEISTINTLELSLYQHITSIAAPKFPIYLVFKADSEHGFIHKFDSINFSDPITNPTPVTKHEVSLIKDTVIEFSLQEYDCGCISNAVVAGIIASQRKRHSDKIFYGKPPSIHQRP